jgi:excisionase family DNA binding protein
VLHSSSTAENEPQDSTTSRKPVGKDASSEPDRLLKVDELRIALGMSRAKVYRMMQDGTLPTVRIGGSVRVPSRALYKWIEDNTKPGRKAF